jgi:TPR repeat protein
MRITALEAALAKSKTAGGKGLRRGLTVVISALMFASGFALGAYSVPLTQTITDLAAAVGFARPIQNADAANAAYQIGDYATALRLLRPLADRGDVRAQSTLGLMYHHGRGVQKDNLEAIRWFRPAAEQGDAQAQLHLGIMYAEGQGMPQDYAEAAKWYRLAADQGYAQALYNLGLAYAKGEGVSQNNVSAHMWLNLAAARFPASDAYSRSEAVRNRDLVASKMTPKEVAEAQKLARERGAQ